MKYFCSIMVLSRVKRRMTFVDTSLISASPAVVTGEFSVTSDLTFSAKRTQIVPIVSVNQKEVFATYTAGLLRRRSGSVMTGHHQVCGHGPEMLNTGG